MAQLDDTVVLDAGVNPADVERALIDAVNIGWQQAGNEGRCNVPANFVGWSLQEIKRLRAIANAPLSSEELRLVDKHCDWIAFQHAWNAVMKDRRNAIAGKR